jgi:hypothetical protein
MGFTKLDEGILLSSVMAEPPEIFKVWIALLAACKEDGIAHVSATAIAAVCVLPLETVKMAITKLMSPDEESRSLNDDGKRIKRVDGGYFVINYHKYREMTYREAEAERKYKKRNIPEMSGNVRTNPDLSGNVQEMPDTSASASASASSFKEVISGDPESVADEIRAQLGGMTNDAIWDVFRSVYPRKQQMESARPVLYQILESKEVSAVAILSRVKQYDFYCHLEYGDEYPHGRHIKLPKNWLTDKDWTTDWNSISKQLKPKIITPDKPIPPSARRLN